MFAIRVLKSVYGSQLGQPHCHLGFAHPIVYGQAITSNKIDRAPRPQHLSFEAPDTERPAADSDTKNST